MKAIVTKFHGPTETRGSRYTATDSDKNSVTVSVDYALNGEGNHNAAALALCRKMGWVGMLVRGRLAKGNVYVFDSQWERLEVRL